ncbi:MAG: transporter [Verrucomicrobiia bacterium]
MNKKVLLSFIPCALALVISSRAEQGGSAHYMPGAAASFIDAFPGKPGGFVVLNYFTYYDASVSAGQQLPLGGLLTAGIDATAYADTLVGVYQTPWNVLGGGLALGVGVSYVWMEVEGQAQRIGPRGVPGPAFDARDTADGIGDMMIYPFMLGWTNLIKDFKLDTRLGIYAPTGDYEVGRLANVGKNYWTFEPGIMASWLSSKIGTEISLFTGVDFNLENQDMDYTSGTSLHFDLTIAQHLPLWGGFVGVGANGFYYEQLTGDSGSDALLGDFEGRTIGVGPVLSYVRPIGKTQLLSEVKWLPELDTDKRLEGDYVWFKLGLLF